MSSNVTIQLNDETYRVRIARAVHPGEVIRMVRAKGENFFLVVSMIRERNFLLGQNWSGATAPLFSVPALVEH